MAKSPEELERILNEATDLTDGGELPYITTMRFVFASNEVFVDLYTLAPDPSDISKQQAQRVYRFVIPPSVAKDFAAKLSQGVNQWEDIHGINLPLKPAVDSSDKE